MTGQENAASLDSIWRLRGTCSGNDSGIFVEPNTYPVENPVCPANLDSIGSRAISGLVWNSISSGTPARRRRARSSAHSRGRYNRQANGRLAS